MNKILIQIAALFCLMQPASAEDWSIMSPYLPKDGIVKGGLMVRMSAEKIRDIKRKFDKAIEKNGEWYANYVKSHNPKEPDFYLPYHPNFGITEKEYEAFRKAYGPGDKRVFENAGRIELQFKKMPNGDIVVSSDNTSNPLHNLRYVVNENCIVSRFGKLNIYSKEDVDFSDKDSIPRSWERLIWKRNAVIGKDGEGPFLVFYIGKSKNKNIGIIGYTAVHLGDNVKEPVNIQFNIEFELST